MNQTESLATLYPESDGKPLAENTKQLEWIVKLFGNIQAIYSDDPNVFVAADLMWYHEQDAPTECLAPDVMVVFERPKGYRKTYCQWDEADIAPQVVFEIRSPSNDDQEMAEKLQDYDEWGVEEYYVYDPDRNILQVYTRGLQTLRVVPSRKGFRSPRLKIQFVPSPETLEVFHPDGRLFELQEETLKELKREQEQRRLAEELAVEEARKRTEAERQLAEAEERLRVEEQKRIEAEERSRADQQRLADTEAKSKVSDERFRRMRELGRRANLNQATDEERAELDRLYQES